MLRCAQVKCVDDLKEKREEINKAILKDVRLPPDPAASSTPWWFVQSRAQSLACTRRGALTPCFSCSSPKALSLPLLLSPSLPARHSAARRLCQRSPPAANAAARFSDVVLRRRCPRCV